jgi:FAD/FMN-containing dehydrogenase
MTTYAIDIAGLEGGLVTLTSQQINDLDSRIKGRLLRPGNPGWDDAVLVWNAMAARVPALVVQPAPTRDIAGTSIANGGLTLDMSRMRYVTVDSGAELAHVGSGCLLKDVDRATREHGLATVLGFVSGVGVAGLTLGGGFGYLARRFGWAVDNLEEVEMVTADGQIRTANRDENADLFWGVRGGGGNFGVVTRFTFHLYPVGPTVTGGLIAWGAERAEEVLATYHDLTQSAPRG